MPRSKIIPLSANAHPKPTRGKMNSVEITIEMLNANLDLKVKSPIPVDELSASLRRFGIDNLHLLRAQGRMTDEGHVETLTLVAEIDNEKKPPH